MDTLLTPDDLRRGSLALSMIAKSTVILAVAAVVAVAARRSSAAARHGIWTSALAGALLLPLLSCSLPPWSWSILPTSPAGSLARPTSPDPTTIAVSASSLERAARSPDMGETPPAAIRPEESRSIPSPAAPPATHILVSRPVWHWIAGVWMAGALVVLSRPLLGRFLLGRAIRRADRVDRGEWAELKDELTARLEIRRRVDLYRGDRAQMPMTWGWLKPVILLPAEFGDWISERRRNVLLHELAHVRRFDCLTQTLAQLACAAYWFNPLSWLAASRMRVERERACDDLVIALGGLPSDYASSLLEMARKLRSGRAAALAAVAMARPSQLEGRLLAILDPTRRRGAIDRRTATAAALFLASILMPLSAIRLSAQGSGPIEGGKPVQDGIKLESKEKTIVAGRVLGPDGKPVAGAAVDIVAGLKDNWNPRALVHQRSILLGQSTTDAEGRFQVALPRMPASLFYGVQAIAGASGFGLGWRHDVNLDAEHPSAEIKLHEEQPIRLKLVDIAGMPAAGVELKLKHLGRSISEQNYDGTGVGDRAPENVRAWPASMKTDGEGKLILRGFPRGFTASCGVEDMRYARQELLVKTEGNGEVKDTVLALKPAKLIEGRVLAADTGRAIPNAVVTVQAPIDSEQGRGWHTTNFPADDQGRFRVNPPSGNEYTVWAFAPAGEPYLIQQDKLTWPKGTVLLNHDIKLPRGVVIRGKVAEAGTGRGIGDSKVQFIPARRNEKILSGWQALLTSEADGSFQIAVSPGKGHLLIYAPTSDYVYEEIGQNAIYGGKSGGRRYYAHKIIPYEAMAGGGPLEVAAGLKPGRTVRGRVVGPDGQAIAKATIITSIGISPSNPFWRGHSSLMVREGRFELHGVPPDRTTRASILDEDHDWGETVELSGKEADEEISVTLRPCGRARARFVRPDGKPMVKFNPYFEFVATPGPHDFSRNKEDMTVLAADADYMANAQRKYYWPQPSTDAEGRVTFLGLIPGTLYRVCDFSTVNDPKIGVQVRRDLTVKPGETVDLGDIRIDNPNF